jgi:hypothetical protein
MHGSISPPCPMSKWHSARLRTGTYVHRALLRTGTSIHSARLCTGHIYIVPSYAQGHYTLRNKFLNTEFFFLLQIVMCLE